MGKAGNALMIAFGGPKGKSKGKDEEEVDVAPDDESDESKASPEEIDAYSELKDALSGGDAETGAMALKNFIQLCTKG